MSRVTIHAAKTQFSKLIRRVEAGEEIVIARGAVPVARLVPIGAKRPQRTFGAMRGEVRVDDAVHRPLPDDELDAWEGR